MILSKSGKISLKEASINKSTYCQKVGNILTHILHRNVLGCILTLQKDVCSKKKKVIYLKLSFMFTLNYKHYCSLNQYFFWKCFWHIPNVCVILTQLLHTYNTKTKIFGFNKSKNSWSSTEIQNMQKNCICYEITWPYNNGISLIANFVKIVMLHIQTFSGDFQHTCDKMHASIVLGMWWWAMCIFLFLKFYNFVILIHSILKRFRPLSLNLTH